MEYLPSGVTYNQRNYSMQPYRFCGKEEVTLNGFDMYDSQARWQYSLIPRFSSMDPLAEDYYHLSPYAYCAGDPLNLVDPDGKDIIVVIRTTSDNNFFVDNFCVSTFVKTKLNHYEKK